MVGRPCSALGLGLERTDQPLGLGLDIDRLQHDRHDLQLGQSLVDPHDDLVTSALEILVVRRARMPAVETAALGERGRALHERDALPLDRLRDQYLRPVVHAAKLLERLAQRGVVVPVAPPRVPAERRELRLQVAEGHDLLGRLVGLELVPVDDHDEMCEPVVGRALDRLPVLTLLELAVPRHDHDPPREPEAPFDPRDPAALGDPHPQRARVSLDARDAHVRVSVEPAEPSQREELLARDHTEGEEHGVETRDVVTLRREEDVPVRVLPAQLGGVELVEEEVDYQVERAEARAEMAGARALDGGENVQPTHVGERTEDRVPIGFRGTNAVELAFRDEAERGDSGTLPR